MRYRPISIHFAAFVLVLCSGFGAGCSVFQGYHLQNSRSLLAEQEGISKIYVEPIANNSYKAGVENTVYNNLVRTLVSHKRVTLVQSQGDADAILRGVIGDASYVSSAGTSVGGLKPTGLAGQMRLPTANFGVSTEYSATLNCTFTLFRRITPPGKSNVVWSSQFVRAKTFPGANQLDVPGTTSALINDSEFERALSDLAHSMMDDVHESMLAMF